MGCCVDGPHNGQGCPQRVAGWPTRADLRERLVADRVPYFTADLYAVLSQFDDREDIRVEVRALLGMR